MADTKISNLDPSAALTGTEIVPVVQSGATVRTTTAGIAALALGTPVPIANGGTGATTGTAALANLSGYTTTATTGGTTTLTNTSSYLQEFTGILTQTIVLPVTSTLQTGLSFKLVNSTNQALTVNSSGGNTIISLRSNMSSVCICVGTTLTTAADWNSGFTDFTSVTGSGAAVCQSNASLTNPTAIGILAFTGATTSASSFHTTQTTGTLTAGGTTGTGLVTLGQSTASQTTNIQAGATASGSTKTVNFGTGGLAGSTTNIAIGSAIGTTGTVNGTFSFVGGALYVNSGSTSTAGTIFLGDGSFSKTPGSGFLFSSLTVSGSAAFQVQIDNAAGTAAAPQIKGNGGATGIYWPNGATGTAIGFAFASARMFEAVGIALGVNYLRVQQAIAASSPSLSAQGTDTNIDLTLTPKGTGGVVLNGFFKQQNYTVATLPSASTSGVGARSFVTDALAPSFGATVVTGGAVAVPVYSDGTNWKVG